MLCIPVKVRLPHGHIPPFFPKKCVVRFPMSLSISTKRERSAGAGLDDDGLEYDVMLIHNDRRKERTVYGGRW